MNEELDHLSERLRAADAVFGPSHWKPDPQCATVVSSVAQRRRSRRRMRRLGVAMTGIVVAACAGWLAWVPERRATTQPIARTMASPAAAGAAREILKEIEASVAAARQRILSAEFELLADRHRVADRNIRALADEQWLAAKATELSNEISWNHQVDFGF